MYAIIILEAERQLCFNRDSTVHTQYVCSSNEILSHLYMYQVMMKNKEDKNTCYAEVKPITNCHCISNDADLSCSIEKLLVTGLRSNSIQ